MGDVEALVLPIDHRSCPHTRDQLPEMVSIKVPREGERVGGGVRLETKPLTHGGEPYTVSLAAETELDVRDVPSVVLQLERGEELEGAQLVSFLSDGPESGGKPDPTGKTKELLLKSQRLQRREVYNPSIDNLLLAQNIKALELTT
jgi:hypothetical protein